MYQAYLNTIKALLDQLADTQAETMEKAARALGDTLRQDGIIYLFGCGHSHMLAEEGFYRAGGLGAVCPILQSDLMLHEGAVKSSALERRAELAQEVLLRYPMTQKDSLIVFSTSGVNGLPVEMARLAKEKGVHTIGVSSSAYWQDASRHPLGLHLHQACHFAIDTGAPHGDASYSLQGMPGSMGPVSTILGAYILNCLLARAAECCAAQGTAPALYFSGNVEGGREKNEETIQRYRHRIRSM